MRFRVYLKPFTEAGVYESDWTEVTGDVGDNGLSDIRQVLDDEEYNVGVFKYADFNLLLRNEHGLYSDVGTEQSIFRYKRSDTLVKITWQQQEFESLAGMVTAGEFIAENAEYTVFIGLLNDEASDTDIRDQVVSFKVLGRESIFTRIEVPYASIANGDTVKAIMLDLLDQAGITNLLTVNTLNINPSLNIVVDDVSGFENQTVKEALDDLLQISNSVLYIKDDTIYVSSRDESAAVEATFYGQASNDGIENIVDLTNIKNGLSRTFNFWTWEDTTLQSTESDSITRYGVKKKAISFESITNNTRRQQVLDAYRDEFGQPKTEFTLLTNITPEMLELDLLDKVTIDYPTVFYAAEDSDLPIYGVHEYGAVKYPIGVWSLTIPTSDSFKVMGKILKTKNRQIEFKFRKV